MKVLTAIGKALASVVGVALGIVVAVVLLPIVFIFMLVSISADIVRAIWREE